MKVTLEDVKKNKAVQTYIRKSAEVLGLEFWLTINKQRVI